MASASPAAAAAPCAPPASAGAPASAAAAAARARRVRDTTALRRMSVSPARTCCCCGSAGGAGAPPRGAARLRVWRVVARDVKAAPAPAGGRGGHASRSRLSAAWRLMILAAGARRRAAAEREGEVARTREAEQGAVGRRDGLRLGRARGGQRLRLGASLRALGRRLARPSACTRSRESRRGSHAAHRRGAPLRTAHRAAADPSVLPKQRADGPHTCRAAWCHSLCLTAGLTPSHLAARLRPGRPGAAEPASPPAAAFLRRQRVPGEAGRLPPARRRWAPPSGGQVRRRR